MAICNLYVTLTKFSMKTTPPHHLREIQDPFVLTIFGASGDLAKLKILPSLYWITRKKRMPKNYYIVGYGRTKLSRKEFQQLVQTSVEEHAEQTVDQQTLKMFLRSCYYFSGKYSSLEDF